jgi:DNA replication initiation complex subunit (GINS family)
LTAADLVSRQTQFEQAIKETITTQMNKMFQQMILKMAAPTNSIPNEKKTRRQTRAARLNSPTSNARTSNPHHHQKIIRLRMSINTKTHKPPSVPQTISTTD